MKLVARFFIIVILLSSSSLVHAKASKEFRTAFEGRFTPAIHHRALDTAAEEPEMNKIKTFVVIEKGGAIPAERAFYMIAPGEYDYRGAIVDGDTLETRKGEIYTYLPKGTVMAVADVVYSGKKVYLKLLSLEKLRSSLHDKLEPTRATVMLGFKFDRSVFNNGDTEKVFSTIDEWVKPFKTLKEAAKYSKELQKN